MLIEPSKLLDLSDCNSQSLSNIVISRGETVKKILSGIIDHIIKNDNCSINLSDIIDRVITPDGKLANEKVSLAGSYFVHGDYNYSNSDELAEATLLPFYAANNPTKFFNKNAVMPTTMPVLSTAFSCALNYIFYGNTMITPSDFLLRLETNDSTSSKCTNVNHKHSYHLMNNIYQIIIQLFSERELLWQC